MSSTLATRLALAGGVPALKRLMARSIDGLLPDFLEPAQAAALAGEPLHTAYGCHRIEAVEAETSSGVRVPLVRMGRSIRAPAKRMTA